MTSSRHVNCCMRELSSWYLRRRLAPRYEILLLLGRVGMVRVCLRLRHRHQGVVHGHVILAKVKNDNEDKVVFYAVLFEQVKRYIMIQHFTFLSVTLVTIFHLGTEETARIVKTPIIFLI